MKSSKTNNRVVRWLRIIHRDLGFLMVGVCFVYAISGILLNHMNGKDPAFSTKEYSLTLAPDLTVEELTVIWSDKSLPELKRVMPIDSLRTRLMLNGGIGLYDASTGVAEYEVHTKNQVVYWINKLHYNKVRGWSLMGDFFAVSLIFFAVSGLFMVKGRRGFSGTGKWFLVVGLLIPVLYIIFS